MAAVLGERPDVPAVRALGIFALKDSLLRPALMDRAAPLRVRVLLLDPDCDAAGHRAAEISESSFDPAWEGHESTIFEIPYTPRGSFWAGYRRRFDDIHAHARRVI